MAKRNKRASSEAQASDQNTTTAVLAPPEPEAGAVEVLELSAIAESPTNPRKTFGDMAELVQSVRAHGVVQPITVRRKGDRYEIVAGHRRFRAAREAGMTRIGAIVRDLDDRAVLEIQLVENVQRKDLHPLEEAEGFEGLRDTCGYTVEQLVERTGKSRAAIYASLKLLALGKEARAAFYAGDLNASVALHVARLPGGELQKRAIAGLRKEAQRHGEAELAVRAAREYLAREFLVDLKDAPFKLEDAELCAKAGACALCPKRTGNMVEQLGDALGEESANLCTDSACFREKCDAQWAAASKAHEDAGGKVMADSTARNVISDYGLRDHSWINLDDHNYSDPKHRTYRQCLKGADLEVYLARHPKKTGEFVMLAKRDTVERLARKASGGRQVSEYDKKHRAEQARNRAKRQALNASLELLLVATPAASKKALDGSAKAQRAVWAALAEHDLRYHDGVGLGILTRCGAVPADGPRAIKKGRDAHDTTLRKAFAKWADSAPVEDVRAVAIAARLAAVCDNWRPLSQQRDGFLELAQALGLDVPGAEKQALEAAKAAKAERKGGKKGAGAKVDAAGDEEPDPVDGAEVIERLAKRIKGKAKGKRARKA